MNDTIYVTTAVALGMVLMGFIPSKTAPPAPAAAPALAPHPAIADRLQG